jgi:hypothetical protein
VSTSRQQQERTAATPTFVATTTKVVIKHDLTTRADVQTKQDSFLGFNGRKELLEKRETRILYVKGVGRESKGVSSVIFGHQVVS